MPVNSPAARPHQETVSRGRADKARYATDAPRSVILIGAGRRGLSVHLPALDACGSLRLIGIVDVKDRIAELTEIPALTVPIHDSLDSALVGSQPDLAIVATPHDSHVPLAKVLLRARVPTLLEKPPARSAPELATLLRLSQELETPLATSLPLHYRYMQFIGQLRSRELTNAEVSIRADVSSWPGADSWRLSRERAGGGVLIDLGYHYLELLVACLGPPDGKLALLTKAADGHGEPVMLRGHGAAVHSIAFSTNGRAVLTGSADRTARLWDARTGVLLPDVALRPVASGPGVAPTGAAMAMMNV